MLMLAPGGAPYPANVLLKRVVSSLEQMAPPAFSGMRDAALFARRAGLGKT